MLNQVSGKIQIEGGSTAVCKIEVGLLLLDDLNLVLLLLSHVLTLES